MHDMATAAGLLIDPILLAITVIYIYGLIGRVSLNANFKNLCMGGAFGLGATFAMLTPIVFADGIIIDMRNLLVGLSGAFFGILGAVVSILLAVITRIYLGGDGALAGVMGIMLAGFAGLFWSQYIRGRLGSISTECTLLGLVISVHLLAVLMLPQDVVWRILIEVAPILVLFNVTGAILIGVLLAREETLSAENRALVNAATTDPLTRLRNRRSALHAYETLEVKSKDESHGTAMLCFDIDNFKSINDSYGHIFGDAVLAEISSRIGKVLRPTDIFSRLGGDEFLIILPSVTLDETQSIAERCRVMIAQNAIDHREQTAAVTISVGAEWLTDHPDFTSFVARADEALYQAKRLGRNCVAFAWQTAARTAGSLEEAKPHVQSAQDFNYRATCSARRRPLVVHGYMEARVPHPPQLHGGLFGSIARAFQGPKSG